MASRRRSEHPPHALVTGGTRGIGLAVAHDLYRRGFVVLLGARDASDGARAARDAKGKGEASGGQVIPIVLDVTEERSVAEAAALVAREHPRLCTLINNAGVSVKGFDPSVIDRTMAVNVDGAVRVTDAFIGHVEDGGTLVMVSSGMGELDHYSDELRARFLDPALDRAGVFQLVEEFRQATVQGQTRARGWPESAYRVSKAALNALTRIYARELAGRGIRVNAVCPGWVRTDMGGSAAPRSPEQGAASVVWAAILDEDGPTGGFFRDGKRLEW